MKTNKIREEAHEVILKCKDKCYGNIGRNAGNESEGDFGTWKDWENVLIKLLLRQRQEVLPTLHSIHANIPLTYGKAARKQMKELIELLEAK